MEKKVGIEELLVIGKSLTLDEFDVFVSNYLSKKADKTIGLYDLDNYLASLSNQIFLLSLHLKQNYLLQKSNSGKAEEEVYYSKKEIAKRYKVQERTISNWIQDGLETVEIGGVVRISKKAIDEFCEKNKAKKFNWLSIGTKSSSN